MGSGVPALAITFVGDAGFVWASLTPPTGSTNASHLERLVRHNCPGEWYFGLFPSGSQQLQTSLSSIDQQSAVELEGRISWGSFLSTHLVALGLTIASLAVHVWFVRAGVRKTLIVDAFAILVGTASLLHLGVFFACTVTRFGLVDGELRCSRIGRHTRISAAVDVVSIDETSRPEAAAMVWLRSGTTLYFPFEHLPNSRELVARLQAARRTNDVIEGCLNRRGIANRLVCQWLVLCDGWKLGLVHTSFSGRLPVGKFRQGGRHEEEVYR